MSLLARETSRETVGGGLMVVGMAAGSAAGNAAAGRHGGRPVAVPRYALDMSTVDVCACRKRQAELTQRLKSAL